MSLLFRDLGPGDKASISVMQGLVTQVPIRMKDKALDSCQEGSYNRGLKIEPEASSRFKTELEALPFATSETVTSLIYIVLSLS